ncbi:hypothetical protein SPURM210S_05625 [Streptomyces purpurascens]
MIQVSVLARLHLPGAVPDLMLLTVLGLALVYGHMGGALVGFGAGLLADLAPPADHAAGGTPSCCASSAISPAWRSPSRAG